MTTMMMMTMLVTFAGNAIAVLAVNCYVARTTVIKTQM